MTQTADAGLRHRAAALARDLVRLYGVVAQTVPAALAESLVKSGTAIGAHLAPVGHLSEPARNADLAAALADAHRTVYWLQLLADSGLAHETTLAEATDSARELVALLTVASAEPEDTTVEWTIATPPVTIWGTRFPAPR